MEKALEFLKSKDNFLILTHINPDGDALGSAFSLAAGLKLLGKNATAAMLAPIPFKYDFREYNNLYMKFNQLNLDDFKNAVSVDCATLNRLGDAKEFYKNKYSLNIDHHITNEEYGKINYIEDCAATGEIIYSLLSELGVRFDKAVRLGIYTAIATDTGNLTFSNTTARSFNICAKMVDEGLNIPYAAGRIFNTRSLGATKLIAAYINKMSLYDDEKVSVSALSLKEIEDCGAKAEDCETLINYGKDIETVEVAVFIREIKENSYKVSMRSKYYVDVAEIAGNFGGGGHVRAAGCLINDEFKAVKRMILDAVGAYIR